MRLANEIPRVCVIYSDARWVQCLSEIVGQVTALAIINLSAENERGFWGRRIYPCLVESVIVWVGVGRCRLVSWRSKIADKSFHQRPNSSIANDERTRYGRGNALIREEEKASDVGNHQGHDAVGRTQ